MNRPVVALDLDDTLLQNRSMVRGIWKYVASAFPDARVDPDEAFDSLRLYYTETAPGLLAYDFNKHLGRYGIDRDEAYKLVTSSELNDGRYEVQYLARFLSEVQKIAEILIVTYGYDDFQRLKASLCPSLKGVEIITTLEGKARVLRRQKTIRFMVDDRPVPDLPRTTKFVMVSLVGKAVDESVSWPVYSSLLEVKEYLYENLH